MVIAPSIGPSLDPKRSFAFPLLHSAFADCSVNPFLHTFPTYLIQHCSALPFLSDLAYKNFEAEVRDALKQVLRDGVRIRIKSECDLLFDSQVIQIAAVNGH